MVVDDDLIQDLEAVAVKANHQRADAIAQAATYRELLAESLEWVNDGDPIACWCETVTGDDGTTVVIPKYSGHCLACRLRSALGIAVR